MRVKFILSVYVLFLLHPLRAQPFKVTLPTDIYFNQEMPFISHQGPVPYDNALAMNVVYAPIKNLRDQLNNHLQTELDYFKDWDPSGEAHITVITPHEFNSVLKEKLAMKEIEAIAARYDIQSSKMMILGLGSGTKTIQNKQETTYFVIVDSYDLRHIRQQVFYEYVRRGGDKKLFDPTWFFPHMTVGFTKTDFHEADGIIKNLKFSLDPQFNLKVVTSPKSKN